MSKINKLRILHFAVFQAFLTTLLGLLFGVIYSFGGFIVDVLVSIGQISPSAASTSGLSIGTVYAFGALIGMPLIGCVIGFAAGLLEAFLYNIFTKLFRGISFDFT